MTIVKNDGQLLNGAPSVWKDLLNRDVFNWQSKLLKPLNSLPVANISVPAVNIKETSDYFLVEVAVPGMAKNDFKIELDDNTLTISSEKGNDSRNEEENEFIRQEFNFYSFYRTFHLAKEVVEVDKITAKYENGLLLLEIPKKEEVKRKPVRTIAIS